MLVNGATYACSMTSTPTRQASAIECQNTKRRIEPSWPYQLVAVEATTIDCASIILPMTPPDELAAPIRIGEIFNCSDVIFCSLPNASIAEIVISEIAQTLMVRAYSVTSLAGGRPIRKPEIIAAISMPDPV